MRGPFPVTSATLSARSIASAPMCRRTCATLRFRLYQNSVTRPARRRRVPRPLTGDLETVTTVYAYSRERHC